jgi:hypothetical protein
MPMVQCRRVWTQYLLGEKSRAISGVGPKNMDKGTLKWLVLSAIDVCGMLGYKVATQASKDGKKEVVVERPEPRFGVVTAILFSDDSATVLIEDQMLHKGDVIHDVKVKIGRAHV